MLPLSMNRVLYARKCSRKLKHCKFTIASTQLDKLLLSNHDCTNIPFPSFLNDLRYAGVIGLLFLVAHLYMLGVWFGEGQRTNTINKLETCCLKEIGLRLRYFINYSTLGSKHNWEDLCNWLRNQETRISIKHN